MDQEPPLNITVGKPPLDPDRVVCDRCRAVTPIERMTETRLTDGTPERAMGGSVACSTTVRPASTRCLA